MKRRQFLRWGVQAGAIGIAGCASQQQCGPGETTITDLTQQRKETSKVSDITIEGAVGRKIPEGKLNADFERPGLNDVSSLLFKVTDTTGTALIIPKIVEMTQVDKLREGQCVVISGDLAPISRFALIDALRAGAPDPNPICFIPILINRSGVRNEADTVIIKASWKSR